MSSNLAFKNQIEIPIETITKIQKSDDLNEVTRTSKKIRYQTERSRKITFKIEQLNIAKEKITDEILKNVFSLFCCLMNIWSKVNKVFVQLDCLLSFFYVSAYSCGQMCRPNFFTNACDDKNFIELEDSWHPCLQINSFFTNTILLFI